MVDHDTQLSEGTPTWLMGPLQDVSEDERDALEKLVLHNEGKIRGRVRAELLETQYANVSAGGGWGERGVCEGWVCLRGHVRG